MKALKKWFPLISLICGALALVMIFLPAGSLFEENHTGLQVCFGDKDEHLAFSIMNTVCFVIGIVGGVLAYLGAKSNNKIMKYVAIVCFVAGVILFICSRNFIQFTSEVPSAMAKEIRKEVEAGIGSILAAIFCAIGAVATVCDVVVKE
ncbi:MAG: hypothetical protein E7364_07450 [Clostridiales bacterium]|nr:hypothetical protein [Clostridiales bacterium]